METSILVALSRQDTLRRHLDVVANNLANMNTTAFKTERMMFADHLVRTGSADGRTGDAIAFVRDVATVRDPADGKLEQTGGDLDVALVGEGYLVVDTPMGERYTRDGHLRLDETGRLVTNDGLPVLTQGGAPLLLGPQDTRISIAHDGTVTSEMGDLGRLRVVRFAHPERMQAVAGGLITSDESPQEVTAPMLLQGMLEGSNVQPIVEMERLIDLHRAYDQAQVLIAREDDRIRKMLQAYTG
jgi:flagellar basal-body rod protein FlgF